MCHKCIDIHMTDITKKPVRKVRHFFHREYDGKLYIIPKKSLDDTKPVKIYDIYTTANGKWCIPKLHVTNVKSNKAKDKTEDKTEDIDDNIEGNIEENKEENIEENIEDNIEGNIEEIMESCIDLT